MHSTFLYFIYSWRWCSPIHEMVRLNISGHVNKDHLLHIPNSGITPFEFKSSRDVEAHTDVFNAIKHMERIISETKFGEMSTHNCFSTKLKLISFRGSMTHHLLSVPSGLFHCSHTPRPKGRRILNSDTTHLRVEHDHTRMVREGAPVQLSGVHQTTVDLVTVSRYIAKGALDLRVALCIRWSKLELDGHGLQLISQSGAVPEGMDPLTIARIPSSQPHFPSNSYVNIVVQFGGRRGQDHLRPLHVPYDNVAIALVDVDAAAQFSCVKFYQVGTGYGITPSNISPAAILQMFRLSNGAVMTLRPTSSFVNPSSVGLLQNVYPNGDGTIGDAVHHRQNVAIGHLFRAERIMVAGEARHISRHTVVIRIAGWFGNYLVMNFGHIASSANPPALGPRCVRAMKQPRRNT